ncbi:capsular polysaccharide biosynthesis protein [Croceicoccus sediminis]|uniref:capsular polysaccharide biosynthesis protein n=1 Tax=Croceicoccus sediminis TaxID=2571150 RepID=UPI0011829E2C|nr:capsular polysaccharide biosynthesis protein [Croceicoccus sediminis]
MLDKLNFTSRGIARVPHLKTMLGGDISQVDGETWVGWGAKPSGRRAAEKARVAGGEALFLEDGFVRSWGAGPDFPPLSIIVDRMGIYYDCTRPSTLETLLQSPTDVLSGMHEEVARAKALIVSKGISKYNNAPPLAEGTLRDNDSKRVLVVDQTGGDLSIALGGASAGTFREMLSAARAENPGATIYVKTHPVTASGAKGGHFCAGDADERTILLSQPVAPYDLLTQMDRVYVVTSTLGFEALLAGKAVTCFGMPWYAGWGATDDRNACDRRTRSRTTDELFAAAYFHYSRYLNPETRELGTIFDVIRWIELQRSVESNLHGKNFDGRVIGVGFRRWKQGNLRPLLGLRRDAVCFVSDVKAAGRMNPRESDLLLWWGTEPPAALVALAENSGANVARMEDGFIRSVGLGSDLIAPLSIVVDRKGLYFDPRFPSELEDILATTVFSPAELAEAAQLRRTIVENGITKYNMERWSKPRWESEGREIVLVPGQVEDDASIRFGCTTIRRNADLLRAARNAHPEAFLVYKPHPDVLARNRKGRIVVGETAVLADVVETGLSIAACIAACDVVHTMTSLSGFDALLRGKRVVTYGQPFYAGWGLTEDRVVAGEVLSRRERKLGLDELVAGTLLRYPLYWDPELRGYTTCAATVARILRTKARMQADGSFEKLGAGYLRRQARKLAILLKNR